VSPGQDFEVDLEARVSPGQDSKVDLEARVSLARSSKSTSRSREPRKDFVIPWVGRQRLSLVRSL